MPELPEVETVCRGLAKALTHAVFTDIEQHRADLRTPMPKNLPQRLKGRRILSISRRAKYIMITLDQDETLVLHLGMSGRMVIADKKLELGKHDHLVFHFDNGRHVRFNDPRRFGRCDLLASSELDGSKLFRHLGIEPLGKDLHVEALVQKFKGKKVSVKDALMNQEVVVGVGNIYASESLFQAHIKPTRRAGRVTRAEIARLVPAIKDVLKAAIKAGGSSLRDYRQADGELGYFQHQFAVYGKGGKACRACTCDPDKTGGIKRIIQAGRSTYYCPIKQL